MSDFFGSPIGTLEGEKSSQDAMLKTLTMQEMGQKIEQNQAMNPLFQQHQQLQNQQLQLQTTQAQAMATALKNAQNGDPTDPLSGMKNVMNAAAQSGNYTTFMKSAGMITDIQRKQALTDLAAQRTQKEEMLTGKNFLEVMGARLGGVKDQDSWDQVSQWIDANSGGRSHYAGTPYDPAVIDQLNNQTLTYKQRVDEQLKQQDIESKDKNRQNQEGYRDFRKGILSQEADIRARREDRLEKAGGKPASAPSQVDQDEAMRVIVSDRPDAANDKTALGLATFDVASRAKEMRTANPALGVSESISRAWQEKKANLSSVTNPGSNLFGTNWHIPGTGGDVTTKYIQGAGSANEPIDLNTPVSKEKLGVGKFYHKNGQVLRWNGKDFDVIKSGGEKRAEPIPENDEDLEDGEDER